MTSGEGRRGSTTAGMGSTLGRQPESEKERGCRKGTLA
jgi:hypothetical protein